jgi:hypothetical protein
LGPIPNPQSPLTPNCLNNTHYKGFIIKRVIIPYLLLKFLTLF